MNRCRWIWRADNVYVSKFTLLRLNKIILVYLVFQYISVSLHLSTNILFHRTSLCKMVYRCFSGMVQESASQVEETEERGGCPEELPAGGPSSWRWSPERSRGLPTPKTTTSSPTPPAEATTATGPEVRSWFPWSVN